MMNTEFDSSMVYSKYDKVSKKIITNNKSKENREKVLP